MSDTETNSKKGDDWLVANAGIALGHFRRAARALASPHQEGTGK